jgi:hypothetical protein
MAKRSRARYDLQNSTTRRAVDRAVKTYEKGSTASRYAPATRQLALLYGKLSTDSDKAYELSEARRLPRRSGYRKTLGFSTIGAVLPASIEAEGGRGEKEDDSEVFIISARYRQLKQYTECKETRSVH